MISTASTGTAERIAVRSLLSVLRAGSGMEARYWSTVLGARVRFATAPRLADFVFPMRAILQDLSDQVHALRSDCVREDTAC